jgi:hypothetical protein
VKQVLLKNGLIGFLASAMIFCSQPAPRGPRPADVSMRNQRGGTRSKIHSFAEINYLHRPTKQSERRSFSSLWRVIAVRVPAPTTQIAAVAGAEVEAHTVGPAVHRHSAMMPTFQTKWSRPIGRGSPGAKRKFQTHLKEKPDLVSFRETGHGQISTASRRSSFLLRKLRHQISREFGADLLLT